MTAPLYVWYRGAFVAIRINADTQEEKKKFIYHKNGGKRMEDYRNKTKKVQIGNVCIGGGERIAIQSMTNTKTEDVEACVAQILKLEKAG